MMQTLQDADRGQAPAAGRRGLRFWLRASRAVSFPLSILPILIGFTLALEHGPARWLAFIYALLGGVAAHAGTNLISDYFDFVKGMDTADSLSSHTGVLVEQLIAPKKVLAASLLCFMTTMLTGLLLLPLAGWGILLFGVAGLSGGFLYTGSAWAFKYRGFGEYATGFLMGPLMVLGAYFTQTRTLALPAFLLSIAVGLLVSAVTLGNNIRDIFYDRQAGFTTMPARLGATRARTLFRAMLLAPYALVALAALADARLIYTLIAFVSLPRAVAVTRKIGLKGSVDFAALSRAAAAQILPLQVIRLHLRFCLLVLAGLCAAVCVPGTF